MDLIQQLLRDEGLKLKPYVDTVGKITIGVGRNLTDFGITEDEAVLLLKNNISLVQSQLQKFDWYMKLDDVRKGAVENMAFNMGINRLLGFRNMISYLSQSMWQEAANEMLNSTWATQVGRRATRLAAQIVAGAWQ